MIKLRDLSRQLLSQEIPVNKYRLQLLAAITTLSGNELRTLARLILPDVDHNP